MKVQQCILYAGKSCSLWRALCYALTRREMFASNQHNANPNTLNLLNFGFNLSF